jgi:hypothetical protein
MAMHRNVIGLMVAACVGLMATNAVAKEKPSATLRLTGKSVSAGIGWSWGHGTLNYKGKAYRFKVDGLEVGAVGASSISATGNVYHLKNVADFSGTYAAVAAGAAAGGGAQASALRNQNGVVIHLKATARGVELKAGVDGLKLTIE